MRLILSTYDVEPGDINIIPWPNPISSYIPQYSIDFGDGESQEEKLTRYIEEVRAVLFGVSPLYDPNVYDSMVFDVDGDGTEEYCVLGFGRTSGLFTFTFLAAEAGSDTLKYDTLFCTEWYDLSFVRCKDGVVRVQAVDQKEPPQTRLFDISVADGSIQLTEDGENISIY